MQKGIDVALTLPGSGKGQGPAARSQDAERCAGLGGHGGAGSAGLGGGQWARPLLRSIAKSQGPASFCLCPTAEIALGEEVCRMSQI